MSDGTISTVCVCVVSIILLTFYRLGLVPILACFGMSTVFGSGLVFAAGVVYGLMAVGKKWVKFYKSSKVEQLNEPLWVFVLVRKKIKVCS